MALKALLASEVPCLDNFVTDLYALSSSTTTLGDGVNKKQQRVSMPWRPCSGFMAIGHRGSGMNKVVSSENRMKEIMENTITSFNTAGQRGVRFVEFDVQVTKDGHAVIFHDDFIVTSDNDNVVEKRIDEVTLEEFLSYGPQREGMKMCKPLLRKSKDGRIHEWVVSVNDSLCTLKDAFQKVDLSIGFNIELKFDDEFHYPQEMLHYKLQVVIQEVYEYAKDRQIFFSSFHPDAALMVRRLQNLYPVLFLTNGGAEQYTDARRNSLEAALQVCLGGELQGIVSEVKGILQNPQLISKIKDSNLCLLTYGQLNNVTEIVYLQYLVGVDGVIVDLVEVISASLAEYACKEEIMAENKAGGVEDDKLKTQTCPPNFTTKELSFILKLIPQLMQN